MFSNKKDADAHDKMLELAEQFTALMLDKLDGLDEKQAEEFGIYLAENKDTIVSACKGKPELLADMDSPVAENVTPISAQA